ncbi:MAG: S-layer homology domain-containing protein [Eubacteriales bacterium]|nr:S-layer homology domain-containing protein [Eubacteriales bacterium]
MRKINLIRDRATSLILALTMVVSSVNIVPAYADGFDEQTTPDGQTWEEAYPDGGFIFKESMKYTTEGDEAVQIDIYRMGGRGGRAVANIAITPAIIEGDAVNAAGSNDFIVTGSAIAAGSYIENAEFETAFLDVVFEDGEYVKSLELEAVDDDLSEPEELVLLTIFGARGAEIIEDGNRFTVCVEDNDPYIPSLVSFKADEIRVDKSEGVAVIEVERSGGVQYVFTVDYETIEDSAVDGVDFSGTSGTLEFKGGRDSMTIEVPLINDGMEDPEPDTGFTVKLSDPKGGSISEEMGEISVWLYNTAPLDASMNMATLLTDSQAIDISGDVSVGRPIAAAGEPVLVVPELKESTPVREAESSATHGGIGPLSIVAPADWKLEANQGGYKTYTRLAFDQNKFGFGNLYSSDNSDDALASYFDSTDDWHTLTTYNSTAGDNNKDDNSLNFGFEASENVPSRVWRIWSDWNIVGANPYGYAVMKPKDLDGLYEFYTAMTGHVSMQLNDYYVVGGTENRAAFLLTASDNDYSIMGSANKPQVDAVINGNRWMLADYQGRGRKEFTLNNSFPELLRANTINVNMDRFLMALVDYHWENNSMFNNWVDDLYLKRAAIANLEYEVVCKDGDSYLETDSNRVLNDIKPMIRFYNNEGGTDSAGNFYIGSKLLLEAPESAGAFRISTVQLKKREGDSWKTIASAAATTTSDLLTNKKSAVLQLRSSDPNKAQRLLDLSCLTADSGQYRLFVSMEREQTVSIDFSPCILNKGDSESQAAFESRVNAQAAGIAQRFTTATGKNFTPDIIWSGGKPTTARITGRLTDLSVFEPGPSDGAQLLYRGNMYGQAFPIATEDYMMPNIGMIFYDSQAMAREQQVRISTMESVTMYLDENSNGLVDAGDTLLAYLSADNYVNSYFAPEKGKDGSYHQKLLKYDYVKVPRKILLSAADDPNLRYDMKASFLTASGGEALEKYTAEMKLVREIDTGDTAIPVYGEASARGSIIVPLGGDLAPPVFDETTTPGQWKWDQPLFTGNHKHPFADPAPITEYETVVGNKTISATDQINAYLGCFRNTDQIKLMLYNDKGDNIDNYDSVTTKRDIVLGDFTQTQDLSGGIPPGGEDNTQVNDTPGAENPQIDLPDINIPAGPFEVILEGNRAGFELGIPLFGASKSKTEKGTKTEKSGLIGNPSSYLDDMKDAFAKGGDDNIFENLKKLSGQTAKGLKPSAEYDVSFELGFSASFMWAYDEADARWEFDEAQIFITFSGEVKISQRLPPVPIIYVYIIFKGDVEIGLNIDVDVITDPQGLMENRVECSGDISIAIEVEAGVGIGVELCKFEIYLKVNIGVGFKLADPSFVDEFEIGAALGFRAVFLCFSFEMDAISFKYSYEEGRTPEEWVFEWSVFGQNQPVGASMMAARVNESPKVRLRTSGRTYRDQILGDSGSREGDIMLLSIPTEDGNFDLGEYNQGASADRLAENLSFSSDYKLFECGGKNYILYVIDGGPPRSSVDADMLVLSEITDSGLSDPAGGASGYAAVDVSAGTPDHTGDLNFDVHVEGNVIHVAWTDYSSATDEPAGDLDTVMAESASNTQLKISRYEPGDAAFEDSNVVEAGSTAFHFLPRVTRVGSADVVLNVKAEPYTGPELQASVDLFKDNLRQQLGAATDEEARAIYPYFDLKTGNYKYMNTLYGKYSTFSFGVDTGTGMTTTPVTPTDDWKNVGTRIEQADLIPVGGNEFYLAYTSSYNHLSGLTNITVKRLYLRSGTIDEATGAVTLGDPLLLRSMVDSDDDSEDGLYNGVQLEEAFIDPFFGGLEFLNGELDPEAGAEDFLLFNMNNRYYVIDEANLESFIASHSGEITPFFELESGEPGDNKGDFSIGVDGDGNISAVYTSPVPYGNHNAVYFTKYDPVTETWGKGVMLAMRGMDTYEQVTEEGWTAEEAEAEFYKDDWKLIFQKPRVAVSASGALQLVVQTVMTELEEVVNPRPVSGSPSLIKIPKTESGGGEGPALDSRKGFYSLQFPTGTRRIGFPSLIFDTSAFVPGSVLAPRISFRNVGDFALRGSEASPLSIKLMLGDSGGVAEDIVLSEWNVTTNVASGERVDTLGDSEDSVYGQTGTQMIANALPENLDGKYLYFTVNEDAGYADAFSFNSLDSAQAKGADLHSSSLLSAKAMGTRSSFYSTAQNRAEVVLDELSVQRGGEIVTIDSEQYLPLDINAVVTNYSESCSAADVRLSIAYRQTDAQGNKTYLPAGAIAENGVILLGTLGTNDPECSAGYVANNNDFLQKQDGSGEYVIRTDGSLEPDTTNDLLVPLSWFDGNAADGAMELRFEVSTATTEFDTTNNAGFARIQPFSIIKAEERIFVVPNSPESFPVEIESGLGTPPVVALSEILAPGAAPLLDLKTYDLPEKTITVRALNDGDTILRIADTGTASFKDVIIKASSARPDAPVISDVQARDSSALVLLTPPDNTGGGRLIHYLIEAKNGATGEILSANTGTPVSFYEFSGLTNGATYQFRAAAVNAAETGLWSDWTQAVTPSAGDYAPIDAAFPAISVQPQDQTVDLAQDYNLQISASVSDSGTLSYQWYSNTVNSSLGGSPIAGATNATVTLVKGVAGVTYYYCVVSNTNNDAINEKSRSVTSDTAAVSVGKGLPVITIPPRAARLRIGYALSESALTGGQVDVAGTFVWENPEFIFTAAGDFVVSFIPEDSANYNNLSLTVHVDPAPRGSGTGGNSLVDVVYEKGHARAEVNGNAVSAAIKSARAQAEAMGSAEDGIRIALDIDLPENADSLGVVMPPEVLRLLVDADVRSLTINGQLLSLDIDRNSLAEILKQSDGDVTIDIKPVKDLSAEAKAFVGNRPVYRVDINDGEGGSIHSLSPGHVRIQIPYESDPGEDPDSVLGVYVDENGHIRPIPNSYYDPESGSITIDTDHFSIYGVGYQELSFSDAAGHWAEKSICFAAARGLFSGTSATAFSPEASMTRGMLVTVLGRLNGADADAYAYGSSNFSDVEAGKYYKPYIEWAYRNGVVKGIGGSLFAPERAISRAEIALVLQNYATVFDQALPVNVEPAAFADDAGISPVFRDAVLSMQKAGIMKGDPNHRFHPDASATRAEVATILHNLITALIAAD